MINKIISFSIHNKLIIGIIMVLWVGIGIYSMRKVPIDAVPDITNNQVQIITVSENLGTEDVEKFITYPVELAVANLPEVIEIRSISRSGLSVVTVVFNDQMGTYLPRQLVSEKLGDIASEIPVEFGRPFMGPISTGLGEIYQYTLEVAPKFKDQYSLSDLREIQDWIVKRQMAMLPGVVEVNSLGGDLRQYQVSLNPHQLKSMGISILDIFRALEQNNANTGGAYIVKDKMANFIRGEGLIRSLDDLKKIVVKTENHIPILLRDIADIHFGKDIRYGAMTKNGQGETVGGMVMLLKDGNSNEVIEHIKERVIEIQKSLPEGITIKPFLDRTKLISNTTKTVQTNLLEGGLIVIFVLVIFLGNFRGGLIVASTIPLSLLFAFILMYVFDVWSNLMSLGAIDFGIIVDGSVIIVESVVFMTMKKVKQQQFRQALSQQDLDQITYQSSSKMMNSAFFGQLIILIVFLPILSLTGIEGKMFAPMALTFSFALIGAMILCLTYVPMVSSIFIEKRPNDKQYFGDIFIEKLSSAYIPILKWSLRNKAIVLSLAGALLIGSSFIFSKLGGEFIPQLDEGDIAFHAMIRPGSSLKEMTETTTKIEKVLLEKYPEIEQIVSKIGVAEIPTDPMPMDIADIFAILKPTSTWETKRSKEELIESIKQTLSSFVGVNFEFSQPIEMRFNELITGVREDIAIKLYGDDLEILSKKAAEINQLISNVQGVGDIKAEATKGLPQITITYNRDRIAQYGLNVEDINLTINTALNGGNAGVIFENERKFNITVALKDAYKTGIRDIQNLFLPLPIGGQIPLKEIAEVKFVSGPMQISRDGTNRRIYVGINVRGRDIASLIDEIKNILDTQLSLPAGYYIRYGGAFENLQKAKERLSVVVPIALGLIFLLLFLALRSVQQTLMIYISIPLATIGGILALWWRDMPFSISAGIGFIVLFGVAVLNSLVLVSSFKDLKSNGFKNIEKRIIKGCKERIRPIFLTASTDILGFLPMALSTSAGAEVQRPLATVVIGGLLTSSLLTLVLLPIFYHLLESKVKKERGKLNNNLITGLFWIVLIGGFLIPNTSKAQHNQLNTVEEAIEIALTQNKQIKATEIEVKQQQTLKKASFDLPKTNIGFEYGQVNSAQNDFVLNIHQKFKFPSYYSNKTKLADAQIKSSELQVNSTTHEIEKTVKEIWYELTYLHAKQELFTYMDSIYVIFLEASEIQYQTETSTLLQKTMAETKVMELDIKIEELNADIKIKLQALSLLLNTRVDGISFSQLTKRPFTLLNDSLAILDNPTLLYLQQQIVISEQAHKVQASSMLPDFSIGYFNQSMIGEETINGTATYIDGNTRFTGVNGSIAIPIWMKSGLAKNQARKLATQQTSLKSSYFKDALKTQMDQAVQEYHKLDRSLNYFESKGLKQAEMIIGNAQKSFENGAIDYVEYVKNMDLAMEIKQGYFNRLNRYNSLVIYMEYLTGN